MLMMKRISVLFLIAIIVGLSAYFYFVNQKPVSVTSDSIAPTGQTTYWVITMWTLIGTGYVSEVCPLPIDDNESIAVAANGWGSKNGRMTLESAVYKFTTREEAEKFRQSKGLLSLELNADELKKYLCIGQPIPPPKDYWVVIMQQDTDSNYFISEVLPLASYDRKSVESAIGLWGATKGFQEADVHSFPSWDEAEKFRKEKGLASLNLHVSTLQKYLCVEHVRRLEGSEPPLSSTPDNKVKPTPKSKQK
jgi:hypothetical protein